MTVFNIVDIALTAITFLVAVWALLDGERLEWRTEALCDWVRENDARVGDTERDVDRLKDKADESEARLKDVEEVLVTVVIALNRAGLLDSALTEQDRQGLSVIEGVMDLHQHEQDDSEVMEALHAPRD